MNCLYLSIDNMFSDFKKTTKAEWLAKVEKDLKGKPLDGLNWELGGHTFSPFFHKEDVETTAPIVGQKASNRWGIGEQIVVGNDTKKANQQALAALEKGADTLCFKCVEYLSIKELEELSEGIRFDWINTHFISSQDNLISSFIKILAAKSQKPAEVHCSFQDVSFPFDKLEEWQPALPKARFLTINALPYYKGDDHVADELANALQAGNIFLEKISNLGLSIKDWHSTIQFNITLGNQYFVDIAKIRALKNLWNQVLSAWDDSINAYPTIQVFLTKKTQTEDEHYNKIMATTQAMSAIIGGADRLFIAPSDTFKNEEGTVFSRRIALNVQHLLQQESYLDRVVDPAAGSYFIETLTEYLAELAWGMFRTL